MKAVLQRVSRASVTVEGAIVGSIGTGLLILLGVERGDVERDSEFLAHKAAEMRIFADEAGKMNKSVKDVNGSVLLISQFTLAAEWKKGRRPSFIRAAEPAEGNRLYEHFGQVLRSMEIKVETGVFGAHMDVALVNDGPVTIILDHQFATERAEPSVV
jgi:D-tyrosyl-tRNA(Tyr) deacylase